MPILMVGTGRVGKEATLTLVKRGTEVKSLLRGGRNHPLAAQLIDAKVQVVEGDLCKRESLVTAVKGAETVICSATSMPSATHDGIQRVDHDGTLALIEAAQHYGVKRFIYVSHSENIRVESPLERAKRDCENRLIRSRMEVAILRPSCFMEDWLSPLLGFDPANGYARIYGSGEEKVSYISAANVADFAVAVASGSVDEKNTILELGGPDALSQLEVVRIFEECLGKVVKIERIPAETLWKQHESADPREQTFAALMLAVAKGDEMPYAVKTARHYRIHLRSVTEYAAQVASSLAVSASH